MRGGQTRACRKARKQVNRPTNQPNKAAYKQTKTQFAKAFLSKGGNRGCVPFEWSGSESMIQDHLDHGSSKEPMNPMSAASSSGLGLGRWPHASHRQSDGCRCTGCWELYDPDLSRSNWLQRTAGDRAEIRTSERQWARSRWSVIKYSNQLFIRTTRWYS